MFYDILNNFCFFVDDIFIYVIVDNDIQVVINLFVFDFDKICKWFDIWVVDFNFSKIKNFDFSRKNIFYFFVQFGVYGLFI